MPTQFEDRERSVIALLCLVGALQVFVLSATFPPFHSVDEPFHFDLVVKYSSGHMPYRLADERLSVETRDAIAMYATGISRLNGSLMLFDSPEYLSPEPAGGVPPPAWTAPATVRQAILSHGREYWKLPNHEATEPPTYYAAAGAWHLLGRSIGLTVGHAFYWTRFLNSALFAGFVWLAYLFARRSCPDSKLLALGVALLAAIFPHDSFYGVSNDGPLGPLLFAAALYSLLCIARSPRPWVQYAGAGVLVAMTVLTKYSNIAILGALVITVAIASRCVAVRSSRGDAGRLAILLIMALAPVAMWFTRNYLLSGDMTGSQQKYALLGWTLKSPEMIWNHPFFGPSALEAFLNFFHGVLATLWRGEIVWHGRPMTLPGVDWFYSLSSGLFLAFAVIRARGARNQAEKVVIWTSAAMVILAIGSLAVLSTVFDFGERQWPPSAQSPYFTNGRLIVGILAPFLTLYVYGLEWGLTKARIPGALIPVVVGLALLVTAIKIIVTLPAAQSEYNWFSLLQGSLS